MKQAVRFFLSAVVLYFLFVPPVFAFEGDSALFEYGVFLGIGGEQVDRLKDYHLVVIEPSEFKKEQIIKLHEDGKIVYGYINIGAIEEYRPYYERFHVMSPGIYENWPDERWIDVSEPQWQFFVTHELGKQYIDMGFDGFFLDNADVYYHYPEEYIFRGLCSIMKGLKAYGVPLIVNGGDVFVSRCMDEGIALSLFDGVNQETVFTGIDFENRKYGLQQRKETRYSKDYLERVKKGNLSVYLLEYGAGSALERKINSYCMENDFLWYNAQSLELQ